METDKLSLRDFHNPMRYGENGFNYSLLTEDFAISRYRFRDEKLIFNSSEEVSDSKKRKFADLLKSNRFDWYSSSETFEQSVMNMIEMVSSRLVLDGHCVFEKVSILKGKSKKKKLIALVPVYGKTKINKKYVIQYVTNEDNSISRKKIPKEKCFVINFPSAICSKKEYLRTLKTLRRVDERDPIKSLRMNNYESNPSYDIWEHKNRLDLKLWEATKKISWHHRSQFSTKEIFSTYFLMLRDLQFRRTKILLLEHILKFIELIFSDIFKKGKISLQFHKSLKDIEKDIEDFKNGNFNQDRYTKIIKDYF